MEPFGQRHGDCRLRRQRTRLPAATVLCLFLCGGATSVMGASPTHCPQRGNHDHARLDCGVQIPADIVTHWARAATPAQKQVGVPETTVRLAFDNTPRWRRRLETLGREGLPFARLKYGQDGEMFIGITRKGMLGVNVRTR